jgi:protein-L-isoaspartate(D-aspartate) O-methyltransferase
MSDARRALAESIRAITGTTSTALVHAFATIPRERFLPPGPWQVRDAAGARMTPDAETSHVYADASIAVDVSRDLYNGQPSTVARWLDALAISPGSSVLHVGCGSGYYSAILAALAGPAGRVVAIEADRDLARSATNNLAEWPWVQVLNGDGITALPTDVDVIVLHAGASHLRSEWLDALAPGGRLLAPVTVAMPAMGVTIGKGLTFVITRETGSWRAKALSFVAIYSMVGARDEAQAGIFGQAMQRGGWDRVTSLRIDAHDVGANCWCHWKTACLQA